MNSDIQQKAHVCGITHDDTTEEMRCEIARITDPRAMLAYLVENKDYLGYDPYYKDLRNAMLVRAEELSASPTDPLDVISPTDTEMSPSRRRVLAAIHAILNEGHLPTVRDICSRSRLSSTSTVHEHLQNLLKSGRVYRLTSQNGGKVVYLPIERRAA